MKWSPVVTWFRNLAIRFSFSLVFHLPGFGFLRRRPRYPLLARFSAEALAARDRPELPTRLLLLSFTLQFTDTVLRVRSLFFYFAFRSAFPQTCVAAALRSPRRAAAATQRSCESRSLTRFARFGFRSSFPFLAFRVRRIRIAESSSFLRSLAISAPSFHQTRSSLTAG